MSEVSQDDREKAARRAMVRSVFEADPANEGLDFDEVESSPRNIADDWISLAERMTDNLIAAGWRPGGAPDPEPWVFRHTGERYAERFWEHPDWVPVLDSDWSYEPRSGAPVTENTELIGRLRADPGDRFEPDDDLLIEAADALERVEGMNEQLRVMNRALERQHSVDVDALEAKPRARIAEAIWGSDLDYTPEPGEWDALSFLRQNEYLINADAVLALFENRES